MPYHQKFCKGGILRYHTLVYETMVQVVQTPVTTGPLNAITFLNEIFSLFLCLKI